MCWGRQPGVQCARVSNGNTGRLVGGLEQEMGWMGRLRCKELQEENQERFARMTAFRPGAKKALMASAQQGQGTLKAVPTL
eukprot:1143247-Pelagomonas_calceolata.AAC.7